MIVINGDGELVPMQMLGYDSVKVETIVGDDIYFEVVAQDQMTLELINMPGNASIVSIYSITGSAVYNAKLSMEKVEIDLSAFDAGLYLIRVDSDNQSFTQRLEIHQ